MATPTYSGTGQPVTPPSTGWLGGLSSFFGGGSATPAYAGAGQPAACARGSFFGGVTPAYATPPTATMSTADPANAPKPTPAPSNYAPCPIDPQALAVGQLAIIIPITGPIDAGT